MPNFLQQLADKASRGYDQLNPLDGGRSYKTRQVSEANKKKSALRQSGDIGGQLILQPAAQGILGASNQIYNHTVAPAFNLPKQEGDLRQNALNPLIQRLAVAGNANGSAAQTVGGLATTGLNVVAPGSSKLATAGTSKLIPKAAPEIVKTVAPKVAGQAATGATVGGAGGGATYLGSDQKLNLKDFGKSVAVGAGLGAAAGVALPLAGKGVVKVAEPVTNKATALARKQNLVAPSALNPNEVTALSNFANVARSGAYMDDNLYFAARDAAKKAGIDYRDPKQVDDLVGAHRNYEVLQSQGQAGRPLVEQKLNALPIGLGTRDVSRTASGAASKSKKQLPTVAVPEQQIGQVAKASLPQNTPQQTSEYLKSLSKAQKQAAKSSNTGLKAKTSDFKEKFIDDLAPIEDRLNQAIKNGAQVDVKDHITYQLDRSRRAEGIMNAYVTDNKLDKLIQSVPNTDEFDQYLIARHAKELTDDIKTGRNAKMDAELVKNLDSKYGAAAKELYGYNQKLLDTATDYGLITKESAAALKKRYPEYVPFNRIFSEDEMANLVVGNGKGNASIGTQSVVQGIKGSDRAIASPLNSIIDKTRLVVEQGERNKAAAMLVGYKDLPGNPFNLQEIPAGEAINGRPTISYLDGGKKRTFLTDKVISDAAKSMSRQDIGLWGRIAAIPARALRGGATAANVGFAGANIFKDMIGAAINSKHPVRIADPEVIGKALQAALYHKGQSYQELMREGVSGTSFDMYRNPLKSNVNEIRSQKNIATRAAHIAKNPGQIYRAVENTIGRSEDFGRALQYYSNKKGYLADGKNLTDAKILAGDQARSNSTNFFRSGSVGKGVNLAIPYWNAGVQGARIQARRIKERPVATLSKIGAAVVAPSALIALNNYSDETKREVMASIPDYEKQANIIIVGPNPRYNAETNKWDGVYKFPVPPQHIGIHNTVQDAIRSAKTDESFSAKKNLGLISENYTTVNPTDGRAIANKYLPQAAKLITEPLTNTNTYTGNKIVPDSQKNIPAVDQTSDYTSGTAKTLGNILNLSPRQIDNTLKTGFGGGGQNIIRATDTALARTGVISKDEVQGRGLGDSIKGRFYAPSSINPSDKADKDFAKYKKEITQTQEYKNASAYDKGRMLNRLETDVNDVAYKQHNAKYQLGEYAPGYTGDEKKLSKKQQTLVTDGFKTANYTNLDDSKTSKGGSQTKINKAVDSYSQHILRERDNLDSAKIREKTYAENDYEYKLLRATYENDKANGKISKAQDITRQDALAKAEIGSKYSKDLRELYALNKADAYNYLANDKNGNKLAEQLLAYDDALAAAGVAKSKFRDSKGNVAIKPKEKSSGSGRGGSRKGSGSRGLTASQMASANRSLRSAQISNAGALNRKIASAKIRSNGGKVSFNSKIKNKSYKPLNKKVQVA